MNWDLRKAERALARGDRDEARVYAWNALASISPEDLLSLLRLARELDDKLLVLEIERRGATGELGPAPLSRAGTILRASLLAVLATAVAVTMFSTSLSEPGPIAPMEADPALVQREGLPLSGLGSGIWLVRVGGSERVPLQKLADDLFFRYLLPIAVQAEIETIPNSALDSRKDQLIGEELLRLLEQFYEAHGNATIIGVTDYDMRSRSLDVSHAFSLRGTAHYGIVSTAHLGGNVPDRIRGNTRYKRTRKLVARNIGFLFLGKAEVDDPHSLFRSQMSGSDDIDALEEKL